MITIEQVREAERQHLTSWGKNYHLSDAYLMDQGDRADYIAWLKQDNIKRIIDGDPYNPY